jgi:type I restriction enzyme S subunit
VNEELVLPKYLYCLLELVDLAQYNEGTTIPSLRTETLNRLEFKIPSCDYQAEVLSYIEPISKKIKLNNKINENLEQQAQALYQELFITNANPDWKAGTISDIGTVIGGSTPSKSKPEYYTDRGIAWITPKDLSINKAKFVSRGENDITELGLTNSSASIMPEGTVLFSSRAPIGYIAIAADKVTTNQGFKSVVPKPEIGTPFVYYFLKTNLPIIEGMASGSTFKEVSGSTMKIVPAVIPDAETIASFNDFCIPLFAQQKVLEEQNQALTTIRDGLLPRLMSGELNVSDFDI